MNQSFANETQIAAFVNLGIGIGIGTNTTDAIISSSIRPRTPNLAGW